MVVFRSSAVGRALFWSFALVLTVVLVSCGGNGNEEITCEPDGVVLEEGLEVADVRCGSDRLLASGMSATVSYEATLANGDPIETGDQPYTFRLGAGQVVQAWDMGLAGMGVGGIRRLQSPSELAYGEAGLWPDVPPDSAVIFEVELLEVSDPEGE